MPDLDPLVDRLAALICGNAQPCYDCVSGAGRALKFLANAGRLLPDGGETRTEWAAEDDWPIGSGWQLDNVSVSDNLAAVKRYAANYPEIPHRLVRREVREWPDGSSWTGPWVEVTDA